MAPMLVALAVLSTAVFGGVESAACSNNYNFDYILLATQWPESFCETSKCVPHSDKWAIHGAWPQNNDGTWPADCCTKQPFNESLLKSIEAELKASWSTLKQGGTNGDFWSHEYSKHGTCAVESPLLKDELSYFKSTLEAFNQLHIDQWLAAAQIVPSATKTYPLTAIHAAVKQGLGYTVAVDCVKSSRHTFPVISQINVCLNKQTLKPFDCPGLKDTACNQASIGYLPTQ